MKIAVAGTSCIGKSTYVNDFVKTWPSYKIGEMSYRKILKERNLPHSTHGTEESQTIIRDAIIDDITSYTKKDEVIFDRGLLDNLAYTLYLHSKDMVSDKFARDNARIIRESMSFYDIIFFMPLTPSYPVEEVEDPNGVRDTTEGFREDVDLIMKAIYQDYTKGAGEPRMFFPNYNCPAIIEIFGNPRERIEMTKLYITESGLPYGDDRNLIT